MDLSIFDNKYLVALASGVGGVALTLITQQVLNKRGLFTYFVRHSLVGASGDDAVFGSVRVTWNGNAVTNLYSSTAELINQSLKDYENIVVRAYTSDTVFLTDRTEIVGTTHIAKWTDEFLKQLEVAPGTKPSPRQIELHSHQRDYLLPTMNRGQSVRFHFLNAAQTQNRPSIWLDVLHKGVRLRFRVPQNEIMGVPQPRAALWGCVLGLLLFGLIIAFIQSVWLATLCALIYGFFAQVPGAWAVRSWRRLREWFGG
ncbi:MAG: hypothetical protein ABSH14_07025 [Verrucomicrobiia bacterium]|jgi:hypothetical protein